MGDNMKCFCFEVAERLQRGRERGFWTFLEAIGRYRKLKIWTQLPIRYMMPNSRAGHARVGLRGAME
jgi:hypothetical protein